MELLAPVGCRVEDGQPEDHYEHAEFLALAQPLHSHGFQLVNVRISISSSVIRARNVASKPPLTSPVALEIYSTTADRSPPAATLVRAACAPRACTMKRLSSSDSGILFSLRMGKMDEAIIQLALVAANRLRDFWITLDAGFPIFTPLIAGIDQLFCSFRMALHGGLQIPGLRIDIGRERYTRLPRMWRTLVGFIDAVVVRPAVACAVQVRVRALRHFTLRGCPLDQFIALCHIFSAIT